MRERPPGAVSFDTADGHRLHVSARPGGGVRVTIGASRVVEGTDAVHLSVPQARALVAALTEAGSLPAYVSGATPPSTTGLPYPGHGGACTVDGVTVWAQESSTDRAAHVWLFQVREGDPSAPGDVLELDAAGAAAVRDAFALYLALLPEPGDG